LDLFTQELIDNDDGDDNISYSSTTSATSLPSVQPAPTVSYHPTTITHSSNNKRNSVGVSSSGMQSQVGVGVIPVLHLQGQSHAPHSSNANNVELEKEGKEKEKLSRPNSPREKEKEKEKLSHKERKGRARPASTDFSLSGKVLSSQGNFNHGSSNNNSNLLAPTVGMKKSKSANVIPDKEIENSRKDEKEKKENLISAVRKDIGFGEMMLTGALERMKPLPGTGEEVRSFFV
jgi:hypothetical protein